MAQYKSNNDKLKKNRMIEKDLNFIVKIILKNLFRYILYYTEPFNFIYERFFRF